MSEPLTVLVVDDEALARDWLTSLLSRDPRVRIVGEAINGRQAIERIRALRPDAILLDVQMPGIDGFGVLEALESAVLPAVIFVTAYDEHAIRAFEVDAIDYVLKPVAEARLRAAIGRVLARGSRAANTGRIVVRDGDRVAFVRTADIDWIESEGDYARIHTAARAHFIRETMTSLEQRLPRREFLRLHRSAIVRVDRIASIEPGGRGDYTITLENGTRVRSGPTYRDAVRRLTAGPSIESEG